MKKWIRICVCCIIITELCSCTLSTSHESSGTSNTICEEATDSTNCPNLNEDFMYYWLVANGQLSNGTDLYYTENLASGEEYTLFYTESRSASKIWARYRIYNYNGYTITTEIPLFAKNDTVEIACTYSNATGVECSNKYSFSKKNFTSKSPINPKGWNDIDPEVFYSSSLSQDEIAKKEYERKLLKEVRQKMTKELDTFVDESTQNNVCNLLKWIELNILNPANFDISDLGYTNYK